MTATKISAIGFEEKIWRGSLNGKQRQMLGCLALAGRTAAYASLAWDTEMVQDSTMTILIARA